MRFAINYRCRWCEEYFSAYFEPGDVYSFAPFAYCTSDCEDAYRAEFIGDVVENPTCKKIEQ